MFTLGGKLALHTAGWTAGLRTAAGQTKRFGKDVAKEVGRGFAVDVARQVISNVIGGLARSLGFRLGGSGGGNAGGAGQGGGQGSAGGGRAVRGKFGLALAALTGGAAFMAKQGMSAVGEIKDFSEQTDQSTDAVQRLQRAAEGTGKEFRHFASALAHLEASRRAAGEGNAETRQQFERFGVTLADINNPALTTADIMMKLGQSFAGLELDPKQRQELRDLGGKTLPDLANALRELSSGKADPIGSMVSEENVKRLDSINKKFSALNRTIRNLAANAAGDAFGNLAGPLERLNAGLAKIQPRKRGGREPEYGAFRQFTRRMFGLPGQADRGPRVGATRSWGDPVSAPAPTPSAPAVSSGPLYEDKDSLEKVKRLNEDIKEARADLLSDTEREKMLRTEILELDKQIKHVQATKPDVWWTTPEDVKLLEAQRDRLKKQGELKELRGDGIKNVQDDLARIGGFTANVGGGSRWQERIARATEETAQNTRNRGSGDITGI